MPEPSQFRHYQIVRDAGGNHVELVRNAEQVVVLAFDSRRLEFVHCHVLLQPVKDRRAFEEDCRKLQNAGHPLLAPLVDFGEDEGNTFFIIGSVDGETLGAYLERQQGLPVLLALMLAGRTLEAATAACERGHFPTGSPLNSLRLLQNGPASIHVVTADLKFLPDAAGPAPARKQAFDKHAKRLKVFLAEQAERPPALADHSVAAAEFSALLGACLSASGPGAIGGMRDLRKTLLKLTPHPAGGEIPSALKPRTLLAPLLASHQDVARGVVNVVRFQSQRLDAANPYTMRGTLTRTGRAVMVEQVPPARLCGSSVEASHRKAQQTTESRDLSSLARVVLLNESEGITCMAEELVEGISLADLLRERQGLDVSEGYLVLASLDAALGQLEAAALGTRKLRLEDIFLLTGFPREDARSAKLLVSRLDEWPAFSVVVRGHLTLASMAGRGTDPALVLPPSNAGGDRPHTLWHGGWLAALGRCLLAMEPLAGTQANPPGSGRERETVARLFDEEIAKCRTGTPSSRADFLARYARIVQQHGKGKRIPTLFSHRHDTQAGATAVVEKDQLAPRPRPERAPISLTAATTPEPAKPAAGFAELLFQGASGGNASRPWAKTAADAPPTIHPEEILLPPRGYVPVWLRASVFIGGSMVAGAIFAHISGRALWQKDQLQKPPAVVPALPQATARPSPTGQEEPAGPITEPVNVPRELPPDPAPPAPNLLTPPSSLKEQITEPPAQ